MLKCAEDEYDSETNPDGRINLGTAVNALVEDLIEDRLKKVRAGLDSNINHVKILIRAMCSPTSESGSITSVLMAPLTSSRPQPHS